MAIRRDGTPHLCGPAIAFGGQRCPDQATSPIIEVFGAFPDRSRDLVAPPRSDGDAPESERAPGTGHQLAQVITGDVLHDASARFERLAAPGDCREAKKMVARRARLDAARTGQVGGEHAADGAAALSVKVWRRAEHPTVVD